MRILTRAAVVAALATVLLASPATATEPTNGDGAGGGAESSRVDQFGVSFPQSDQGGTVAGANQIQGSPKTSLPDIEDEVMCPVCGTLLALASESPQANRERDLIRGLIAQGLSKDQIKDRLVAEFGSEVLATPSTDGFDLAAWLVPGLAVIVGAIAIFLGLRRWRRETDQREDAAASPSALSDEDAKRLETDLGKYEL